MRRLHRTVHVRGDVEASHALAEFVAEVRSATTPHTRVERDITVDEAVERFLAEHLQQERGREQGTIEEYRGVRSKWFSPEIGGRRLRDIDEAMIDRLFGRMREAGLSASRMNAARNLYAPMFRWARRRGIVARNPMAEFELPTSLHVARERLPPEADQDQRDRRIIADAVRRLDHRDEFVYDHRPPHSEPLLWAADGLAWLALERQSAEIDVIDMP